VMGVAPAGPNTPPDPAVPPDEPDSTEAAGLDSGRRSRGLKRLLRNRIVQLVLFDLIFIIVVTAIRPDFARTENLKLILENFALQSIVMTEMVLLLAAGRFDLSVDGTAAVTAIVSGRVMAESGVSPYLALAIGLALGAVIGVANGWLIEHLGLNPLITTLATWWITTGAALGLSGGVAPSDFPQAFLDLGQARIFGLLITTWYAIVILPIVGVVLWGTRFGYHVKATGGNRDAARLNGVKVRRIGVLLFALSGLASAFAGVIFAAQLGSASPVALDGMALDIIAAAVIGGASLYGGRGSVIGGLLGLLLLNMIGNASIYVGISPFWQKAIAGTILLIAIFADATEGRSMSPLRRRLLRRQRSALSERRT